MQNVEDHRVISDEAKAALIPGDKRCKRCDGTGNEFLFMYHKCPACNGDGISRGNEDQFEDA